MSLLKPRALNIYKFCYEWFVKARNKGILLSSTLIKSKAKERMKFNYDDFSASSIKMMSKVLPKRQSYLIEGCDSRNIYNADKTGSFFRALPDKTFALKCEKCTDGKMAKDRLTILHYVNMAGERERLFVIGKSARPRTINLNILPWRSKKAWITSDLMTDFLVQFDRKIQLQECSVVLFLDNAASHPRDLKL